MEKHRNRSRAQRICCVAIRMAIAGAGFPAPAAANALFTWDPSAVSPSLDGAFTANAIEGIHNLYDIGSTINPYTVNFLEQITSFTLNGTPVATPRLNGTPGAAGSYGLYLTMQAQTRYVGPPNTYQYLSGNVALMLDPGDNNGAASATPSGLTFANTGASGAADDITLATGKLVSGHYVLDPSIGIRSIGDFVQTFRPVAGESGFFVAPASKNEMIELIDTTFPEDISVTPDPSMSDPTRSISVLNGGTLVGDLKVPEPSALLTLSAGFIAIASVRTFRRSARSRRDRFS